MSAHVAEFNLICHTLIFYPYASDVNFVWSLSETLQPTLDYSSPTSPATSRDRSFHRKAKIHTKMSHVDPLDGRSRNCKTCSEPWVCFTAFKQATCGIGLSRLTLTSTLKLTSVLRASGGRAGCAGSRACMKRRSGWRLYVDFFFGFSDFFSDNLQQTYWRCLRLQVPGNLMQEVNKPLGQCRVVIDNNT